ncbi:hypothetical protein J4727_00205 [Providencia rettgeri]|uniref:Uncharacterized protein n=1 Tax=Providencia rettgeri TaxID=587 RepID=A0A939SQV9_PRORE|nr:hypothetical protein [Providencia rettgeri]
MMNSRTEKEYQQQLSSIMGASDAESAATIYAANDTGGLVNHFGELFGPATNPTGAMNGEESRNMNVLHRKFKAIFPALRGC